ncbi:MAG: BamA/TamA family outer membrane protein [Deltaproteobacteria bacterium]|nr:BamA/TamA family outer membrane protein [Deltaproteobacteria bacterium]
MFANNAIGSDLVKSFPLDDYKNKSILEQRYKSVATLSDLSRLFKDIEKSSNISKLELHREGDQFHWVHTLAHPIRDIKIKTSIRFREFTQIIRNKYVGRMNSLHLQGVLVSEILENFERIGYPHAQANLSILDEDGFAEYVVEVWPGLSCIIADVQAPESPHAEVSLEIGPGDRCDINQIKAAVENYERKLIEEGFQQASLELEPLQYSRNRTVLNVHIRGVIGKKIDYLFIDESKIFFGSAIEEDMIQYFRENFSDPRQVRVTLIDYFKRKGYDFVSVKGPYLQKESDDFLTYIFLVNPGIAFKVSDMQIEGNSHLSTEDIKAAIDFQSFWESLPIIGKEKSYEDISKDIQHFYHSKGFWKATVQHSHTSFDRVSKSARMNILIDEGLPHMFRSLTITGNQNIDEGDIRKLFPAHEGDPLLQNQLIDFEYSVQSKYFEQGFIESKVATKVDTFIQKETVATDVTLLITEGPLVRIGTITIKGLVDTREPVVRRELLFSSGDTFNQELINQSRTALVNLGIFSSVAIERSEIKQHDSTHEIDIVIRVKEGDPGRVKFGPGFNLTRGLQYVGEISYNNLGGTGRRVNVRAAVSEERQQQSISDLTDKEGKTLLGRKVGLGFTEPYLLNLPVHGNISLYHQAIADDVWKLSNSIELSLSHHFSPDIFIGSVTPFYRFSRLRDEGTREQRDSLITTGSSDIGALGVRYRLDRRDSLLWPTKGFLFNIEASWARYNFFGQYRYFKWHLSSSQYFELMNDLVFAFGIGITSYERVLRRGANAETVDVLPANNRLLAGGSNEVRGFDHQLGPYVLTKRTDPSSQTVTYDREPPLGGSKRLILKSELRRQVVPNLLALSTFLDIGNSFFSLDEEDKFNKRFSESKTAQTERSMEDNFSYDFSELVTHPEYILLKNYQSYGLALNLLTPLGSFNAAVALPLREPSSDRCRGEGICFQRAKDKELWFQKFKVELNIGAEF